MCWIPNQRRKIRPIPSIQAVLQSIVEPSQLAVINKILDRLSILTPSRDKLLRQQLLQVWIQFRAVLNA